MFDGRTRDTRTTIQLSAVGWPAVRWPLGGVAMDYGQVTRISKGLVAGWAGFAASMPVAVPLMV